jgi:hypothetical protein
MYDVKWIGGDFFALFCHHKWRLVKHQIGKQIAVFSIFCPFCKSLQEHTVDVDANCEAREPIDLLGRPH